MPVRMHVVFRSVAFTSIPKEWKWKANFRPTTHRQNAKKVLAKKVPAGQIRMTVCKAEVVCYSDWNSRNSTAVCKIPVEKFDKVEIFLEQREVAFLSPSKFSQILLGDKDATYFCSKIISTLQVC